MFGLFAVFVSPKYGMWLLLIELATRNCKHIINMNKGQNSTALLFKSTPRHYDGVLTDARNSSYLKLNPCVIYNQPVQNVL
jgi:hypothetical protein